MGKEAAPRSALVAWLEREGDSITRWLLVAGGVVAVVVVLLCVVAVVLHL